MKKFLENISHESLAHYGSLSWPYMAVLNIDRAGNFQISHQNTGKGEVHNAIWVVCFTV